MRTKQNKTDQPRTLVNVWPLLQVRLPAAEKLGLNCTETAFVPRRWLHAVASAVNQARFLSYPPADASSALPAGCRAPLQPAYPYFFLVRGQ